MKMLHFSVLTFRSLVEEKKMGALLFFPEEEISFL
jgi:hypothetical protein